MEEIFPIRPLTYINKGRAGLITGNRLSTSIYDTNDKPSEKWQAFMYLEPSLWDIQINGVLMFIWMLLILDGQNLVMTQRQFGFM